MALLALRTPGSGPTAPAFDPWTAVLDFAPARRSTLARCVLLALLLHLWAVVMVGNVPGGSAAPGAGVGGAINVTLRGTDPLPGAALVAPPAPLPPADPPGTAPDPRWGGRVRNTVPPEATAAPAEPGAAHLGEWAPTAPAAHERSLLPAATAPLPRAAVSSALPPSPGRLQEEAAMPMLPTLPALSDTPALPALGAAPAPDAPAPLPGLASLPALPAPAAPPELPALPALRIPQALPVAVTAPAPVIAPAPAPAAPAVPVPPPQPERRLAPIVAAPATAAATAALPAVAPLERSLPLTAAELPALPATGPALVARPEPATVATPTTATAAAAPPPTPAAAPARLDRLAAPAAPVSGSPVITAPKLSGAGRGAPDAGPRVGADVATPPSAAASAPRLNLDLPRHRGTELSGQNTRGVLQLLPRPPEKQTKLATDIEKTGKTDCRTAHSGLGLLAVVPLALDAVSKDGCKW